jgi:hypothetical protein
MGQKRGWKGLSWKGRLDGGGKGEKWWRRKGRRRTWTRSLEVCSRRRTPVAVAVAVGGVVVAAAPQKHR